MHCTHALCTARDAARRIGLADKEALLAGQYLGWGGVRTISSGMPRAMQAE